MPPSTVPTCIWLLSLICPNCTLKAALSIKFCTTHGSLTACSVPSAQRVQQSLLYITSLTYTARIGRCSQASCQSCKHFCGADTCHFLPAMPQKSFSVATACSFFHLTVSVQCVKCCPSDGNPILFICRVAASGTLGRVQAGAACIAGS